VAVAEQRINFRKIFRVFRFSTFTTKSATSGLNTGSTQHLYSITSSARHTPRQSPPMLSALELSPLYSITSALFADLATDDIAE
jgi:hypothetical protein